MNRYFLRGLNRSLDFEIAGGVVSVGRNPQNRLVIPEGSVSSFHAEMKALEGGAGVWVRDLNSTNGTFVDGAPVQEAVVNPGRILQLGTVELRLEAEQVEIRIPSIYPSQVAAPAGTLAALPDGTLACSRNPLLPATHQASGGCQAVVKCPGVFNSASLRGMALAGGAQGVILFCPDCNARCETIQGAPEPTTAAGGGKRGFLARLTQTIQLGRWRP
jgi:Inner membrane component of T3SS, cytoplasmic domain